MQTSNNTPNPFLSHLPSLAHPCINPTSHNISSEPVPSQHSLLSYWLYTRLKCDHRSNFSNLSNWKGEARKKIRASTGFEPVASAMSVRCSTNWVMKPHVGSEVNLLSSYFPVQWSDVKYIWNNSYLYCGCIRSEEWSSQITASCKWKGYQLWILLNLWEKCLKFGENRGYTQRIYDSVRKALQDDCHCAWLLLRVTWTCPICSPRRWLRSWIAHRAL